MKTFDDGDDRIIGVAWTTKGKINLTISMWKDFNYNLTFHRIGGNPAIEYNDGTKVWYVNGKKHRTNGPAVIKSNGLMYWFINGIKISNIIIDQWLEENQITWPFSNENELAFKLRFIE